MLAQQTTDWLDVVIGPSGALALLLVILWAGARGTWVFGRELKHLDDRYEKALLDLRTDRDEWKQIALHGTALASKAVDVAAERPA